MWSSSSPSAAADVRRRTRRRQAPHRCEARRRHYPSRGRSGCARERRRPGRVRRSNGRTRAGRARCQYRSGIGGELAERDPAQGGKAGRDPRSSRAEAPSSSSRDPATPRNVTRKSPGGGRHVEAPGVLSDVGTHRASDACAHATGMIPARGCREPSVPEHLTELRARTPSGSPCCPYSPPRKPPWLLGNDRELSAETIGDDRGSPAGHLVRRLHPRRDDDPCRSGDDRLEVGLVGRGGAHVLPEQRVVPAAVVLGREAEHRRGRAPAGRGSPSGSCPSNITSWMNLAIAGPVPRRR